MHPLQPRHTLTRSIWLGYVFFVIYGSLVPLDFRPLAIDQAWVVFQSTPMYRLGVASRADWIANGVLYVPVGFLTAQLLIQTFSGTRHALPILLAGLFSAALAFGVEFTQIFFPPRTVSLNDLLAECIGSLLGLALAARYSVWFKTLLNSSLSNPERLALRLLEAYLVAYVAFSLFPFDLLISGTELEQKLRSDNWGWLLAGDLQDRAQIVLKLLSEVFLTLPFGLFFAYRSANRRPTFAKAALLGALLGGLIEIAQLFTASGVSQGVSVLTRAAGVCAGLALWNVRHDWSFSRFSSLVCRYTLPLGLLYVFTLAQMNGWLTHSWSSTDSALSKLGDLHFLPFYYHYFTTEAKALVSLAVVSLTYLPIGLLTWSNRGTPALAFFIGLTAAMIVESGKLFLQGMHPDPTNALLGGLAAWGMVVVARSLSEQEVTYSTSETGVSEHSPQIRPLAQSGEQVAARISATAKIPVPWGAYALLMPTLAFAAYWTASFPTQPALLGLFLATCAAAIWRQPVLLVTILPAALPVFDLAPWSGRFYLDEFDLLVLIGLAIGYARIRPASGKNSRTDYLFSLACSLIAISFAISAARGLTPWQMPDANAFTNYYSPFNALRIGKGALFALLLYGLLRRLVAAKIDIQRPLAAGMIIGLAMTVAIILWERLAFSGLFNFESDYRVTGPFSAMHTGGALIECFLVVATPFVLLWLLQTRSWIGRLAGGLLLLATTYALMVTFSRNGYSAFGVVLIIILFFATFKSGQWRRRSILAAGLTIAMLAVAVPVFTGKFAQERIATVASDYVVRQAHWQDALDIRTPDLATTLFGVGLGRYPEGHYLLSREESHSGTYQLLAESQNTFLRLVSGNSIYLEQIVPVEPQKKYLLKLDVRANRPDATITIPICEKWLLASYNCAWSTLNVGKEAGTWHHIETRVVTDQFGSSHWYDKRPIKLGLYNGNVKTMVDVDNVQLETVRGENLLRNGSFSEELDHWFFSADSHLQWHAKSLPVAVLFDQGWFGLMAFGLFSFLALQRATSRAWQGDLGAAASLASLSGFLVVGLFDTLIDAPRFLFLLLLLGWFCISGDSAVHRAREN